MTTIARVVDAVNVILRRLDDLPSGPEVAELRDRALGCIEGVVDGNTARPFSEVRDATMLRVLALHVATNRVASTLELHAERRAGLVAKQQAAAAAFAAVRVSHD